MTDVVEFNGTVISDMFQVINVTRPMAGRSNSTKSVSGMDGLVLTGSSMTPITIGVTILLPDMSISQRRERIRELSAVIHTDEQKKLMFGSDGGLYYKAILDGSIPVSEHVRSDLVTLNFVAESPVMYGDEGSATIPSGGSVSFVVGGTYRTQPVISGNVTASSDGTWGLRLDDRTYMRIDLGGRSSAQLVVDCAERYARLDGALAMIDFESDWIEFEGGSHVIRNDVGTGQTEMTWVERWV